jgi:iron complex outermembrane receptor protein
MEAGFKLAMAETLTGTLSLYEVTRTNITQLDRDATLDRDDGVRVFRPSGEQRTRGLELDLLWRPNENYSLVFGYSWMFDAELVSDPSLDPEGPEAQILFNRRLENTPEHMLSLWNKYTLNDGRLEGLELGIGVRYVSKHMPRATNYQSNLFNDASLVLDALVAYGFRWKAMDVKVAVDFENLTDELYQVGHVAADDPFKANLSVTVTF